MSLNKMIIGVAMVGGLVTGQAAFGVLLIDDFNSNQSVSQLTGVGSNSSTFSGAGPIGGVRDMSITITGGTAATPMGSADSNITNLGRLTASLGNNSNGITTVIWDGSSTDASNPRAVEFNLGGGAGIDFTQAGSQNALEMLAQSDLIDDVIVTLYTDALNYSTMTLNLPGLNNTVTLTYTYASFTNVGAGVNFAAVKAMKVEIDGSSAGASVAGLDANIQFIRTTNTNPPGIPEPLTAGLGFLGLGALGLVATRRRRA